ALPVGFGSNVPGIPPDFQYAGSKYAPLPNSSLSADYGLYDNDDEDWHDTLFDSASPRRIPGFLIFMVIICIAVFLLCGRDRRSRIYRKLIFPFHNNRGGATNRKRKLFGGSKLPFFNTHSGPTYERVLEDGSRAPNDFELGPVDGDHSDDNDHSDSSEDSRAGRSSGWATPRLKFNGFENSSGAYFDNVVSQGVGLGLTPASNSNAMDRSGLVVRTESRERLGPLGASVGMCGLGSAVGGRRSRAGSPVRFKSPLMTPLAED
ncbi:MAG: Golgi apyrase, partial [Pleopsidium flavum]